MRSRRARGSGASASARLVGGAIGGAPASRAHRIGVRQRGGLASGSRRRPINVGYLPKDIVNKYFAAAKTGIDKAAGELGGTVTQVGPNEAKADLQIPFITDLTTQGVNAIIISADDPDAVAPALKEAMDAGIKVVGFDSSPAVGAYDVFVNQADFSGVGDQPRRMGLRDRPGLHRRLRDPLGGRDGDQPERLDRAA